MFGLMQARGLLISSLIEHAAMYHAGTEIVSRTIEGPVHRTNWAELAERSRKIAGALDRLGVAQGERIATLAWNGFRHMELYFGVSGSGRVLHTVNPRLFAEQLEYIINHGGAHYLFFDLSFVGLVESLAPRLTHLRGLVVMTDRAHMPSIPAYDLLCYEDLVGAESPTYAWPSLDENRASTLCYTSGTTGNPKGVLYSHRSTLLHSFATVAVDGLGLSAKDSVFLVVPLFHANAWGIPYGAAMCGAKLVLPGARLDGESVWDLLTAEACTMSAAVPTVWLNFFEYIEKNRDRLVLSQIRLQRVVVGGSAAPRAIIEAFDRLCGAFVVHAWGMTETSPLATVCQPLARHAHLEPAGRYTLQQSQGRAFFGVELKITGSDGEELPRDGIAFGDVKVRGPWITAGYFRGEGGQVLDEDGWFATGDVATLDPDGYLRLVDRSKDVIKSGGEWISSIDMENAALLYPGVLEAAVIGVAHPKWAERPLLLLRCAPDARIITSEVREFLAGKFARWWLPDDVVLVDSLPHTATGKLLKTKLREQFSSHYQGGRE
jgi:fatty-acyl-CoA synthase